MPVKFLSELCRHECWERLDQPAGIFLGCIWLRSLAEQRFEHLLHNLRLQLWNLSLQSLCHGVFDALPRLVWLLVWFLVLFRHAWRTVFP